MLLSNTDGAHQCAQVLIWICKRC